MSKSEKPKKEVSQSKDDQLTPFERLFLKNGVLFSNG